MKSLYIFSLFQPCIISDCGEHQDGDSWGTAPNDGTGDVHPDFPEDSDMDFKDVSTVEVFDLQGHGVFLADSIRRLHQGLHTTLGHMLVCCPLQIQPREMIPILSCGLLSVIETGG